MPKEDDNISFLNQPVGLKGDFPWETNRGLSCITTGAIKEYCSGHGHTYRGKSPDRGCRGEATERDIRQLPHESPAQACEVPAITGDTSLSSYRIFS